MSAPSGRYIIKGTKPYVCKCGVITYRVWAFSAKAGRFEHSWVDCEVAGAIRPNSRRAGEGQVHVCKAMEKSA